MKKERALALNYSFFACIFFSVLAFGCHLLGKPLFSLQHGILYWATPKTFYFFPLPHLPLFVLPILGTLFAFQISYLILGTQNKRIRVHATYQITPVIFLFFSLGGAIGCIIIPYLAGIELGIILGIMTGIGIGILQEECYSLPILSTICAQAMGNTFGFMMLHTTLGPGESAWFTAKSLLLVGSITVVAMAIVPFLMACYERISTIVKTAEARGLTPDMVD